MREKSGLRTLYTKGKKKVSVPQFQSNYIKVYSRKKNESPWSLYYAYRMGQSDSTEEKMGEEGNVKQGSILEGKKVTSETSDISYSFFSLTERSLRAVLDYL